MGNLLYPLHWVRPRQGGGRLYLTMWLDRSSRKVVGWDMREVLPEDLASEALHRALAGLIVHSVPGSTRFKKLLTRHGA